MARLSFSFSKIKHAWKMTLAAALAVVLMLSVIPFTIVSAVDVSTEAQLKDALATSTNTVVLKSDITITNWTSVSSFKGTINGNGYVISGLKTSLITNLSATVYDLGIVAHSSGANCTGLLASKMTGGSVTRTFAYGKINYTGSAVVGGLIGTMSGGAVSECFSTVFMNGTKATHAGGLIGLASDGTITACYSSGDLYMKNDETKTAGLANLNGGSATDTYSSCQIRYASPFAKPSGVDGLYDNQMSLVRENAANPGKTTLELMTADELSDKFAVTSTTYPSLRCFLKTKWSDAADHVILVSTAAVSFSDGEETATSVRYEPDGIPVRTDYLLTNVYADKTNAQSLKWSIDSTACTVLDTVPYTFSNTTFGASPDLLRSKYSFTATTNAVLTATSGGASRNWYMAVYNTKKNPYFNGGTGASSSSPFQINTLACLNNVRYYALISNKIQYKVTADIAVGNWVPISEMSGVFDGDNKVLSSIQVVDHDESALGLFGTTQNAPSSAKTTIKNVVLLNASVSTDSDAAVGTLIGSAGEYTVVSNIVLKGTENTVNSTGYVGGLIGKTSTNFSLDAALVSVQAKGKTVGGLVGAVAGGTINRSGVTGYIVGTQYAGGLVGETTGTTTLTNTYSTAPVISDTAAAYVGGLIGKATSATINKSYCAALAYASSHKGALVGQGGTTSTVVYDSAYASSGGITTAALMAYNFNDSAWKITTANYPQLSYFVGGSHDNLSKVSTVPVYIQQYWPDVTAKEMTTGWVDDGLINQPEAVSDYCDNAAVKVYAVNSGYGFEASGGQARLLLTSTSTAADGLRAFGFVRDNMISLTYQLTGTGANKTHVTLYFKPSGESVWQTAHVSSKDSTARVVYDIPKGSSVKATVHHDDAYQVNTVVFTANGTSSTIKANSAGEYAGSSTYSHDVLVKISMKSATPPWGLRRESY